MKRLAILLGAILALMLTLAGVLWVGSGLRAQSRILTARADAYPEVFESIQSVLRSGAAPQVFEQGALGDAGNYTMMDVTLSLTNRGFLPAEWLHMSLVAQPGDIAVYSLSGEGTTLPARSDGTLNLKLITTKPGEERAVELEYYVFGVKRQVTVLPGDGEE